RAVGDDALAGDRGAGRLQPRTPMHPPRRDMGVEPAVEIVDRGLDLSGRGLRVPLAAGEDEEFLDLVGHALPPPVGTGAPIVPRRVAAASGAGIAAPAGRQATRVRKWKASMPNPSRK